MFCGPLRARWKYWQPCGEPRRRRRSKSDDEWVRESVWLDPQGLPAPTSLEGVSWCTCAAPHLPSINCPAKHRFLFKGSKFKVSDGLRWTLVLPLKLPEPGLHHLPLLPASSSKLPQSSPLSSKHLMAFPVHSSNDTAILPKTHAMASISVLIRVSIAVIKHHDQKQLGEGRTYFTLYHAGKSGLEVKPRSQWITAYWLASPSLSACCLLYPRATCLGVALPTVGWILPHQSLIRKVPQRPAHRRPIR